MSLQNDTFTIDSDGGFVFVREHRPADKLEHSSWPQPKITDAEAGHSTGHQCERIGSSLTCVDLPSQIVANVPR